MCILDLKDSGRAKGDGGRAFYGVGIMTGTFIAALRLLIAIQRTMSSTLHLQYSNCEPGYILHGWSHGSP